MSHVEDFQGSIDEVMSKVIGKLGLDSDKVRYEILESNDILFMSNFYYVRIQFDNKTSGQDEELFIVLKRPMASVNQTFRTDLQFHNEILFYQMYARSDEIYAKCFYVENRLSINSIIALENVNKRGYYSCPHLCNPPLEYTLAVMRELGRFHGKGYVMKELQREKFFDIVAQIREVRYEKRMGNLYEFCCNILPLRAVEYLRSQRYDAIFCDKMETFLMNAFEEVMMKTIQPLEPLATLCHGDFTLNNILFKTEDDGQYRPLLIDFALITYSTPVIDLSTYINVCCSNELRKDKFFDIMRAYHDALKEYMLDAGIQDIEKYSYNALLNDFRRGALFGFVIACIFTPIILGYLNPELILQDILNLGHLGVTRKIKSVGGDNVSKILADALLQLKDLDCLKHVL